MTNTTPNRPPVPGVNPWLGYGYYGYSFEYKSPLSIAGWPLLHVCSGVDPQTLQLRVAKGVIAIGNIAIGVLAIGGLACGLITVGGLSLGLLTAIGGAAFGLGMSVGALAVGSMAIGAVAVGFSYAIGSIAFGPAVIDITRCDGAVLDFGRRWLGRFSVPPSCR